MGFSDLHRFLSTFLRSAKKEHGQYVQDTLYAVPLLYEQPHVIWNCK